MDAAASAIEAVGTDFSLLVLLSTSKVEPDRITEVVRAGVTDND